MQHKMYSVTTLEMHGIKFQTWSRVCITY